MQQTGTKGVFKAQMNGEDDLLGIVPETEIYHTMKLCGRKLECVLENATHDILWDFEIKTGDLILTRRTDLVIHKKD